MRKDFSNLYTYEKAKNYIPTTSVKISSRSKQRPSEWCSLLERR